jgi:hypothetical protein
MPPIAPFRGLRLDPARAPEGLLGRFPESLLADPALYDRLRGDSALFHEPAPVLYRHHATFQLDGKTTTRKSLIALVRLSAPEDQQLVPLEAAPAPTAMTPFEQATRLHCEVPVALFSDPTRATVPLFEAAEAEAPVLDAADEGGVRHRLWTIADPTLQHALRHALAPSRLHVVHGAARLAAMAAFRDTLAPASPDSTANHAAVALCDLDDPGTPLVTPHRLFDAFTQPDFSLIALRNRVAGAEFDVREYFYATAKEVKRALAFGAGANSFAVIAEPATSFFLFSLRRDVPVPGPLALRTLDVQVLQSMLFEQVLGLPAGTPMRTAWDLRSAIAQVRDGSCRAAFMLSPPTPAQICKLGEGTARLPAGSLALPPLGGGPVLAPIDPAEEIIPL